MCNSLHGSVKIVIDRKAVACPSFMGFGVEWDPGFWHAWNVASGVTEADWDLVVKRIAWMKIPVVRMMMQVRWCRDGQGRFDWDRAEMKNVYRYLDVCQKQGITVILTDWGCEPGWLKVPDIVDVGDPTYAAAIGTYMDHLVNGKGYSCIKYFVMVNEPNYEVKDFTRWKKGVENVAAEFTKRGLDKKVTFAGSDESNDEGWHRNAVDQLQKVLGAYDIHRYALADEVRSGALIEFFRAQWNYALQKDPGAKTKPMFVGESGIHSDAGSGNNPMHLDYEYGLDMADYAAQAVAAGSWSVCAWMLDDSSHKDFTWGMWKNKSGGFALKPWFYAWALLCRSVPAGSKTYLLEACSDLRVVAASSRVTGVESWTFCLVNRSDRSKTVKLHVPDSQPGLFMHYLYSREHAAADWDGFPIPIETQACDLRAGVEVTLPGNAVYLLTSVNAGREGDA